MSIKTNTKMHNHDGQVLGSSYFDVGIKSNRTLHTHRATDVARTIVCYTIDSYGGCGATTIYTFGSGDIPYAIFKFNCKIHTHTYTYAYNCSTIICYEPGCAVYNEVESCSTGTKNITGW